MIANGLSNLTFAVKEKEKSTVNISDVNFCNKRRHEWHFFCNEFLCFIQFRGLNVHVLWLMVSYISHTAVHLPADIEQWDWCCIRLALEVGSRNSIMSFFNLCALQRLHSGVGGGKPTHLHVRRLLVANCLADCDDLRRTANCLIHVVLLTSERVGVY